MQRCGYAGWVARAFTSESYGGNIYKGGDGLSRMEREREEKVDSIGVFGQPQKKRIQTSTQLELFLNGPEEVEGSGPISQWAKAEIGCGEKISTGDKSRLPTKGTCTDCTRGGWKPKLVGAK
ncbi:hypothetical protein Ancab_035941 [Ancistrocladus abbreviatus]